MSKSEPCHRCGAKVEQGLPRPGLTSLFGKVIRETWRIRFNFVRMNSWENAVTAHDVIASSFWTEVTLCSDCWGDVMSLVCTKIERKEK